MKVELLPWKDEDIPSLVSHANNRHIWEMVRDDFPHPYTEKDAREWIALNRTQDPPSSFSISVDGTAVGAVGAVFKTDVYRKNVEIGYWLTESFWNLGITSEAVRQFCLYCFARFDAYRLYAGVFDNNPASMHVLRKNGFEREGIMRSGIYKNHRFLDEHIFGKCRV
jgi:RimJ/RimL family protein N-acetyltransferase